jgi:hypothetical protein
VFSKVSFSILPPVKQKTLGKIQDVKTSLNGLHFSTFPFITDHINYINDRISLASLTIQIYISINFNKI